MGSRSAMDRRRIAAIALTVPLVVSGCREQPAPSAASTPETATSGAAAATSRSTPPGPPAPAASTAAGGGYIPEPRGGPTPEWARAVQLFREGNTLQFKGRLDEAIDAYQRSLAAFPTAESYTFLGWTYAWKGRLEDAIAEAQKAIKLDPDYGNPYNDIGLYLIELNKLDEAVGWLQKAIKAERYQERQFPHLNLGRIWTRQGLFDDAFAAFEQGLRIWRTPSLPDLPAVKVRVAETSGTSPPPGLVPELKAAMDAYFKAWNTYAPQALIDASTPHPPDVTEALLQHLAQAKLRRVNMVLVQLELRRFTEDVALVEADVQTEGASNRTQYILQRHEGVWKVMGPAAVDEVQSSDSPTVDVRGQENGRHQIRAERPHRPSRLLFVRSNSGNGQRLCGELPLARVVDGLGQDARSLLRRVEPHRILRGDEIEAPLPLAV